MQWGNGEHKQLFRYLETKGNLWPRFLGYYSKRNFDSYHPRNVLKSLNHHVCIICILGHLSALKISIPLTSLKTLCWILFLFATPTMWETHRMVTLNTHICKCTGKKKKISQKNCLYFMQCTNSFYSITTFLFYIKPSQDHILLESKYPLLTYSLEKNTALCVTVIHSGPPVRRNIYLRLYYVSF